ncbi:threonine synthase [Salimicrobium halophilum]|uniref:Threonine synthase n=1 Tax=Salimicrobium halophilum TaxID=86666 RepID=A0A1G8SC78_9BACI|nr:threonine synthase [Salimicrobium halophilum]SDJ26290.1 L-threonine synthase [Salimicrobium halophilum]
MEHIKALVCVNCGHKHEVDIIYECKLCGHSLDVEYDYEMIFSEEKKLFKDEWPGIWKYRKLLPVTGTTAPVSLGEGRTPFLEGETLAEKLGVSTVFLKNEAGNPTLSFKDRPLSVALTLAKERGIDKVVTASTGNTGVAAAAYAARAGIMCEICVPETTPQEKLTMMEVFGAEIKAVEGTFSDAYDIAKRVALEQGWLNLTSTFLNPYAIEGDKTLAYEIYEQYGEVPDHIIIPIGAGPLLVGCYKGFQELKKAGMIENLPKMVGVQAEACAPIAKAFEQGEEKVGPWKVKEKTVAGGIADPLTSYPDDGTRTLETIRESGGVAIAVSDDEIMRGLSLLAESEGIFVEPSSSTAIAALRKMVDGGGMDSDESVVCVCTGHGLKDASALKQGRK